MNKFFLAALAAVMLLLQGCAGVQQQKSDETPVKIKYKGPVKVVKVLVCYRFWGSKDPMMALENPGLKYSEQIMKSVEAFFKASEGIFSKAGLSMEMTGLHPRDCGMLSNVPGEDKSPTLLVVFFAVENMLGQQSMQIQASLVPPGGKGRLFSQEIKMIGRFFDTPPEAAAEEILGPLIEIIKEAQTTAVEPHHSFGATGNCGFPFIYAHPLPISLLNAFFLPYTDGRKLINSNTLK